MTSKKTYILAQIRPLNLQWEQPLLAGTVTQDTNSPETDDTGTELGAKSHWFSDEEI